MLLRSESQRKETKSTIQILDPKFSKANILIKKNQKKLKENAKIQL